MNRSNLSSHPLVSQQIAKLFSLKKRIKNESGTYFGKIEEIKERISEIRRKISSLPSDNELLRTLQLLHAMVAELRSDIALVFTDIEIIIESVINSRNPKPKGLKITPFVKPDSFIAIYKLFELGKNYVYSPFCSRSPQHFASILAHVDCDPESGIGDFNPYLQDVFERVYVYRNELLVKSLNNLSQAMKDRISFSSIEGFVRAFAAKMITDYKVTTNIPRLIMCVQRLVYPLVYVIKPEFFPFNKVSVRKTVTPKEIDVDNETFQNALNTLNNIIFMSTPIDMVNTMLRAGSLFVDSYMIKHNFGVGVDFGAQELLPILEKAITNSYIPTPLSIFSWLDSYCQETEMAASAGYIITSFLTVTQYTFEEKTQ